MQSLAPPLDSADAAVRRHDVDWLRVGALGLLIVYHSVISFQPWAFTILFIQNRESMDGLWPFMSMINVWRIPILFLVSGMGVRFAMQRRDWKQLLGDRALRILLPLVFGYFLVCPISVYFALGYYGKALAYHPSVGHLWFLGNIFAYVVVLLPLFVYLRNNPESAFLRVAARWLQRSFVLALAALPLLVEAWIVDPQFFVLYAQTPHGFWLGLLCFLMGFVFVSLGAAFWQAAGRVRHPSLAVALCLYLARAWLFAPAAEINVLLALESTAWMIAILGYGSRHLNHPSRALAYGSKAVYPVYILHLPVQYALSYLIIPLALASEVKLALILVGTLAVSLGAYELVVKRVRWVRPLFGMKWVGRGRQVVRSDTVLIPETGSRSGGLWVVPSDDGTCASHAPALASASSRRTLRTLGGVPRQVDRLRQGRGFPDRWEDPPSGWCPRGRFSSP